MCSGSCACGNAFKEDELFSKPCNPKVNPADLEEKSKEDFNLGFAEGFRRAREIFWEEFQIKASDANMVARYLNDSDKNSIEADGLKIMAATYLHAADILIRDRREYPGYIEKGENLF